jgi:hypothetical protein
MNCYDCASLGRHQQAVAVCVDCGAAVCPDHAITAPHWLTRTQPILRIEQVEPPARLIRCATCQRARTACGDLATTATDSTGR